VSAYRLITLLALRYRLLWAHVRSNNGRIVLVIAGGLVVACLAVLFALGGVGAAAALARTGRAELVLQLLMTGIFVNATLGAVLLGTGVSPVFSDAVLRGYSLSRLDRLAARHVTALLEPLWLLVLTLVLGLAVGFSTSGATSPWLALLVAALFVLTNYLLACVVARLSGWILSLPAGSLIVMMAGGALLMMAPLAPAVLARVTTRHGGAVPGLDVLALTPPFAAARAMATAADWPALVGLLLLVGWAVGLGALLIVVERLPPYVPAIAGIRATWDHPCDRIAAITGPRTAPLVGKMLRYYVRSAVRYNYPFVLPVLASMSRHYDDALFAFALGVAPVAGFVATVPLSLNLFGMDRNGFRRYFLLPVPGAHVFRTVSLVSLVPGGGVLVLGVLMWLAFPQTPPDARMIAMVATVGVGGLLFFHALGLWTTLMAPRAIPFGLALGNRNSPPANALMVASFVLLFGLPVVVRRLDVDAVLDRWWVAPVFLVVAGGIYVATIRAGARLFVTRRERMIELLEEPA
jgi:hypothetical protein